MFFEIIIKFRGQFTFFKTILCHAEFGRHKLKTKTVIEIHIIKLKYDVIINSEKH